MTFYNTFRFKNSNYDINEHLLENQTKLFIRKTCQIKRDPTG